MKKLRNAMVIASVLALTFPAMAQESSGTDAAFTKFLADLKTDLSDKITEILPVLGGVAIVALSVFIAFWFYKKIRQWMGR